jgi:hypothetical protein
MDQERSNRLERHFPAGATLFEQEDTSREMYILRYGEADVLVNDERIAVVTDAGSYMWERSTLLSESRTSTVRTRFGHSSATLPHSLSSWPQSWPNAWPKAIDNPTDLPCRF